MGPCGAVRNWLEEAQISSSWSDFGHGMHLLNFQAEIIPMLFYLFIYQYTLFNKSDFIIVYFYYLPPPPLQFLMIIIFGDTFALEIAR